MNVAVVPSSNAKCVVWKFLVRQSLSIPSTYSLVNGEATSLPCSPKSGVPTRKPTLRKRKPTMNPTRKRKSSKPNKRPSARPDGLKPSKKPTKKPLPSISPTRPTLEPTHIPSDVPINNPTQSPTFDLQSASIPRYLRFDNFEKGFLATMIQLFYGSHQLRGLSSLTSMSSGGDKSRWLQIDVTGLPFNRIEVPYSESFFWMMSRGRLAVIAKTGEVMWESKIEDEYFRTRGVFTLYQRQSYEWSWPTLSPTSPPVFPPYTESDVIERNFYDGHPCKWNWDCSSWFCMAGYCSSGREGSLCFDNSACVCDRSEYNCVSAYCSNNRCQVVIEPYDNGMGPP